ncbi:MAG: T9SS type A sorting domain-containing protein [Chlorobi bacterium]|nr:T9SS type A sorting domain-containing protein [Chlorobiota bacterium]
MKKNVTLYLILMVAALFLSGQCLTAQIDFNNTSDLTTYFNANTTATASNISSGGLANTGSVNIPGSASDLFTEKTGYATSGSGDSFTVSGYFFNNSNSGFGNLGFAPFDVNQVASNGGPLTGISVAFHGGGMYWQNDGAIESSISWTGLGGGDLPLGNWFKFIFTMVNNGSSFDLSVEVWNSDANGTLGTLATSESLSAVSNVALMGASSIYPCFGARYSRISYIDDYDSSFSPGTPASQNTALDFDGTNGQGVETGTMIPYNATSTVMGWHYKKAASSRIFSWGSPQVNKYVTLEFYNNQFRSYSPNQGEGNVQTSNTYPSNAWYHFAVVKDAGTVTIYIDGVVAASGSQSYTISPTMTSLGAGLFNNSWQGNGNGISDDLSVWDIALSQADIVNYMSASPSGSETGIVANYDFDTPGVTPGGNNTGYTTLYDVSGNGYDGTLLGFPLNGPTGNWVDGYVPPPIEAIWLGTSGNLWGTAANWNTTAVPDANTNATIPAGTPASPVIAGAADCNDLAIDAGATLTIQSDATGTGTLINNGTITSNGTVDVQRYFSGNDLDWHLISCPISTPVTFSVFLDMYVQGFYETDNSFIEITDETWVLNQGPMPGYGVYSTLGNTNTVTFSGDLIDGPQSRDLNFFGLGWNLLGNPYSASIDWESVTIPSGMTNEVHYIEASTGNDLSYVQGVGGTGSQYIPPMQGFFVKATVNWAPFTIDNTVRSHNGSGTFYKNTNPNLLVLKASNDSYSDETWIHFNVEAGVEHDGFFDAYKRVSTSNPELPQIFSVTPNGDFLSVNGMPEVQSTVVGFSAVNSGEFTISASEKGEFADVVLEDTFTGTQTDLLEGSYTFDYIAGDNTERFIIHFSPLSVDDLSVENHTIYAYGNQVSVTATEGSSGSIRVFNTMGQLVVEQNLQSGINKFTVNATGTHIVQVISDKGIQTKKVMIR